MTLPVVVLLAAVALLIGVCLRHAALALANGDAGGAEALAGESNWRRPRRRWIAQTGEFGGSYGSPRGLDGILATERKHVGREAATA